MFYGHAMHWRSAFAGSEDGVAVEPALHLALDWQDRFLRADTFDTVHGQQSRCLLETICAATRHFAAANISTIWAVTGAAPAWQRLRPQQADALIQRHGVPPELAALMRGWLLVKARDSAFSNPQLLAVLRQRGIRRLLLSGFQSHHCIAATARDAAALGFACHLLSDLVGGTDDAAAQRHRQLCDTYGQHGTIGVQRLSCLVPGIVPARRLFRRVAQPLASAQALFRREQAALLA